MTHNKKLQTPGSRTKAPKAAIRQCPLMEKLSQAIWSEGYFLDAIKDKKPLPLYVLHNPKNMKKLGELAGKADWFGREYVFTMLADAFEAGMEIQLTLDVVNYLPSISKELLPKLTKMIKFMAAKDSDFMNGMVDRIRVYELSSSRSAGLPASYELLALAATNETARKNALETLAKMATNNFATIEKPAIDAMNTLKSLAEQGIDISPALPILESCLHRTDEEQLIVLSVFLAAAKQGADILPWNNEIISVGFAIHDETKAKVVEDIQIVLLEKGGDTTKQVIERHLAVWNDNKQHATSSDKSRTMLRRTLELFKRALDQGIDISETFPFFVDALTEDVFIRALINGWFFTTNPQELLEHVAMTGNKATIEALTKTIAKFIRKSKWLGMHAEKNDEAFEDAITALGKTMRIAKRREELEYPPKYYDPTHDVI